MGVWCTALHLYCSHGALYCLLPCSALVASDALAVASENTTFAAVSSWIAHQQHQQALLQQAAPACAAEPR